MTSTPQEDDKHVSPMEKIFDFSVRPGVACVKPEIAKRLTDAYKKGQAQQIAEMARQSGKTEWIASAYKGKTSTMTSHPPEDDWTAEDLANQRRISEEVERQIDRWHMRMGLAVALVGALLAVAIHFLGKP